MPKRLGKDCVSRLPGLAARGRDRPAIASNWKALRLLPGRQRGDLRGSPVLPQRFQGEATHSTPAIDFRFDIREENVPRLQTQFGIQVSCLDSAESEKTRLQAALAVHGGRRRIDNSGRIHLLVAEYLVSFEKNGTRLVGRQKVRRYHEPPLNFHARNGA